MTAAAAERILAREGLAPLDFDDGAGGIKVGNRGSGKLLDSGRAFARESAAAEADSRRALQSRRFKVGQRRGDDPPPSLRLTRGERRIVQLISTGSSIRVIARRTGKGRGVVYRLIRSIKRRRPPELRLGELLASCEPTTIILVFSLLERALEAPGAIRRAIAMARAVPAIRALLEPDEVRNV